MGRKRKKVIKCKYLKVISSTVLVLVRVNDGVNNSHSYMPITRSNWTNVGENLLNIRKHFLMRNTTSQVNTTSRLQKTGQVTTKYNLSNKPVNTAGP